MNERLSDARGTGSRSATLARLRTWPLAARAFLTFLGISLAIVAWGCGGPAATSGTGGSAGTGTGGTGTCGFDCGQGGGGTGGSFKARSWSCLPTPCSTPPPVTFPCRSSRPRSKART